MKVVNRDEACILEVHLSSLWIIAAAIKRCNKALSLLWNSFSLTLKNEIYPPVKKNSRGNGAIGQPFLENFCLALEPKTTTKNWFDSGLFRSNSFITLPNVTFQSFFALNFQNWTSQLSPHIPSLGLPVDEENRELGYSIPLWAWDGHAV